MDTIAIAHSPRNDGLTPAQDLHWRIGGIFILLATSALGAILPILAKNRHDSLSTSDQSTSWAPTLLDFSKYLGSGIIIGTAFVHLLNPAFKELSDPSLPEAWKSYDWAPAITMAAVFGIFTTELLAFRVGTSWLQRLGVGYDSHGHVHSSHGPCEGQETSDEAYEHEEASYENGEMEQSDYLDGDDSGLPPTSNGNANGNLPSSAPQLSKGSMRTMVNTPERRRLISFKERQRSSYGSISNGKSSPSSLPPKMKRNKSSFDDHYQHHHPSEHTHPQPGESTNVGQSESQNGESNDGETEPTGRSAATQIIGVAILEFGVLLHSFIIGMTLAVVERFFTLFIVITLHQTFEGLGLGSRLAALSLPRKLKWVPMSAAILFGAITPAGLGVGLLVRKSYDPNSPTSLIVSGVLDSLAAGVLLYTGLVELLASEFVFHQEMREASLSRVMYALSCVLLGATVMAVLGIWA